MGTEVSVGPLAINEKRFDVKTSKPNPTEITHHKKSRILEVTYDSGDQFRLPTEYLRVYSPSAEVRGHGPGQEVLQVGKQDVEIDEIEPMGNYAVKLRFSDGHDTGIYSWDYLYELGKNQEKNWADYLDRLRKAGESRGKPVTWRELKKT